ncbi:polyketide synthase [Micromonospora profundi]|uniref:beta-ketoacyl [acyl carrier protein] synthase domain-containing protein n=1 Tax=Micromonospora profundi TaxID=1420889 RepID=UPI0033AE64F5
MTRQIPIAVIGMACRAPGVDSLTDLWDMLLNREQRFVDVSADRWYGLDADVAPTPRAGLMDDVDRFDARSFGISSRMAVWMDPQHRMLLELAWHALENAGLRADDLAREPVGVFVGAFISEYRDRMIALSRTDSAAFPGTLMTFLANRISHQFDWTGPSMVIDSACSSSLAALHLAAQGLASGEFPMAVVAAANVTAGGFYANTAARGGALSPSGDSVPFSAGRDGYIRGEGGACVVLKTLEAAMRDGDPVHAIVAASGVAHNGRGGGLTATDRDSIAELMRRTAAGAGLSVSDIGFLEAHGTATPSGDAQEVAALAQSLSHLGVPRPASGPAGQVWIGSIKSNVGHLEAASGLMGVVKAVLTVQKGVIAGVAGLTTPDPSLPTGDAPVRIATDNVSWESPASPRRAAVSSFGLGGTLSHVVIEQARLPRRPADTTGRPWIVPLGGPSEELLVTGAVRLLRELELSPELSMADIALTMQGRVARPSRRILVARTVGELAEQLRTLATAGHAAQRWADSTTAAALTDAEREACARWLAGEPVDWAALWEPAVHAGRAHLPGTPFDRRSYWFDDLFRQ